MKYGLRRACSLLRMPESQVIVSTLLVSAACVTFRHTIHHNGHTSRWCWHTWLWMKQGLPQACIQSPLHVQEGERIAKELDLRNSIVGLSSNTCLKPKHGMFAQSVWKRQWAAAKGPRPAIGLFPARQPCSQSFPTANTSQIDSVLLKALYFRTDP